MERLNEYLQTLLSKCGYELRLEPNKQPYVLSDGGTTDIGNAPLLGTQISTMIFPLIPHNVRMELPNKPEVEFTHAHNLGDFSFTVKKSPSGFNVTIRPVISDTVQDFLSNAEPFQPQESSFSPPTVDANQNFAPPPVFSAPPEPFVSPVAETQTFHFESSPFERQETANPPASDVYSSEIIIEETASESLETVTEFHPEIEITSVNDPEFITTFSDTSTYEPPGRRDEIYPQVHEYVPPQNQFTQQQTTYTQPAPAMQNEQIPQPPENFQPTPENFYQETAAEAGFVPAQANPQTRARMDALFHQMAQFGASDLHLSVSMPPMVRKDGKMQPLPCNEPTLAPEAMRDLLTSIMPSKNQEEFARRSDSDFAYEIPGLARFRANIFMDRKGMGGVFRIIPTKILTAEQLGLSPAIMNLCALSKGLVVVTGPTGSGKSTTLCAMIDHINKNRDDHIITIEDPIEFTHENQKCLVNQREVHNHTDSFKDALRAALREDPDILLVGEMRDLETISIAIETAETGHLVFGTLHTTTAASTVDRIIDQFPADRQQQIRVMLSESLKGVIAQTLLPKKGGGRVAALEVLIVTPAISNLIREGKTFQIPSAMQTGKAQGMVMLNDALFDHVKKGLVEPRDAYIKAVDKAGFESLLQRNGFKI
jgi:twitching motility protein PilT